MHASLIRFQNILYLACLGFPKYDPALKVGGIYQHDMSQLVYLGIFDKMVDSAPGVI